MAKRILASVLLVVLILTTTASFSSARLFNGAKLAATEPANVNLVLPRADAVTEGRVPSPGMRLRAVALRRRARKYGALFLNMLPKGRVPPSGPSKGTNTVNN